MNLSVDSFVPGSEVKMFCPKCGTPDQSVDSYCRQCGVFLPDFDGVAKRETAPETHLTVSVVLSSLTALISAVFGILLSTEILGPDYSVRLVRAATVFLWCICLWQISILWRTAKVIKQIGRKKLLRENDPSAGNISRTTARSLKTADLSDVVPPSVVEKTTMQLQKKTD